jgi:hypothetical protein
VSNSDLKVANMRNYFCELAAHAKFPNPMCLLSDGKVRASKEQKKTEITSFNCQPQARLKPKRCLGGFVKKEKGRRPQKRSLFLIPLKFRDKPFLGLVQLSKIFLDYYKKQ